MASGERSRPPRSAEVVKYALLLPSAGLLCLLSKGFYRQHLAVHRHFSASGFYKTGLVVHAKTSHLTGAFANACMTAEGEFVDLEEAERRLRRVPVVRRAFLHLDNFQVGSVTSHNKLMVSFRLPEKAVCTRPFCPLCVFTQPVETT